MKKIVLFLSLFILISCSTFNSSDSKPLLNRKTASVDEYVKIVKVKKDIILKLGEVNHISEYCYINPIYSYVYKSTKLNYYVDFDAYEKEKFKGKALTLRAGTELNVYFANSTPQKTYRFPYRTFSNGKASDPEVYHNQLTVLTPYSEIPARPEIGGESYLSLNLVCRSNRFSTPWFGDKYRNRVETRESYIRDVNETMADYLNFDGEVLLLQNEPDTDYY